MIQRQEGEGDQVQPRHDLR